MNVRLFRLQLQRLLVLRDGLVNFSLPLQRQTKAGVGLNQLGVRRQSAPKLFYSSVQRSLQHEHDAETVVTDRHPIALGYGGQRQWC